MSFNMKSSHEDRLAEIIRKAFCAVFCPCNHRPKPRARITLGFGSTKLTFEGDFTMQVPDSGGPFTADITGFVDSKGNPTTDSDVPVWASSDESIAGVAVSDTNPQEAVVTLKGPLGQVQITATFGDPANGGFVVTGTLEVQPGAAVSATMAFSGPGITP